MTLVELSAKMPGSLLLISELTFLWTVVNYALVPDPVQEANRSSADRPTVAMGGSVNATLGTPR